MSDDIYFDHYDSFGNLNTVQWRMPGLTVSVEQVGVVAAQGVPEAPLDGHIYGRQNAIWEVVPVTVLQRGSPVLADLPDTSIPGNSNWVTILPPTSFPIPSRSGNTLIEVVVNIHLIWNANTGSEALCDWSIDGGASFQRTLHSMVNKQDNSTVNGTLAIFHASVSGTAPTVFITGRQVVGPGGLQVVGYSNPTWPTLGSRAAIFDMGPL